MAGGSKKAVAEGESRTQSESGLKGDLDSRAHRESGLKGDLESRAHRESGLVLRDLMRFSLEQGGAEASRVARELLERQEARLAIEGKRHVTLMKLRAEFSEQLVQVLEEEQRKAVKAYGEEQAEWGVAVRNDVQAMHKQKENLAVMEAVQRLDFKDMLAEMREVRAARSQWEEQERNRKEENFVIDVLKEELSFELRERKEAVVVAAVSEEDAERQKNEVEEEVAEVVVLEKPKDKPVQIEMSIETQGTGNEKPAEKAVGVSEPAASSRSVEEVEVEEVGSLDRKEEEFVVDILDYELGFLVVEKEEEVWSESDFEEEICITEEKVGRLVVVDGGKVDFFRKDPSVVGWTKGRLEAFHHPVVRLSDLCFNLMFSTEQYGGEPEREDRLCGVRPHRERRKKGNRRNSVLEQPQEQSRATEFSVVGGDVGTAHSEKEEEGGASPLRRRKKLLEVQRAHDSAD